MAARRRQAKRRDWPDNLHVNGDGYYYFRHPDTGKSFGIGRDLAEAKRQVKTVNAELERRKGHVELLQRIDGGATTLAAWCDTYLNKRLDGNKHTVAGMKSHIKAIKEDVCAAQAIGAITPRDVAKLISSATENRGASMAGLIRGRLRDIFREAIEHGLMEAGKNPVDAVLKPKREVTRQRLTLNDFMAIRKKVAESSTHSWLVNAMDIALLTGQRREDIASMKFDQARDGFLWVEQSKTGAKIMIPLELRLDALGASLDEILKRCRDAVVSRSVIHYVRPSGRAKPGTAVTGDRMSTVFSEFRDESKIVVTDGNTPSSFHEIRSLSARLHAEQHGADFAQALLGHKSEAMTALYRDSRGREWAQVRLKAG